SRFGCDPAAPALLRQAAALNQLGSLVAVRPPRGCDAARRRCHSWSPPASACRQLAESQCRVSESLPRLHRAFPDALAIGKRATPLRGWLAAPVEFVLRPPGGRELQRTIKLLLTYDSYYFWCGRLSIIFLSKIVVPGGV